MFNRSIQMKLIKTQPVGAPPKSDDPSFTTKLYISSGVLKDVSKDLGKAVAAYIVLDTFRQVAVILASK